MKFHAEQTEFGYWCVLHTATRKVCHIGLTEDAAREIAATMREAAPTDL